MKDYDELKVLWQQAAVPPGLRPGGKGATARQQLQRQLLLGAISLSATVLALGVMAATGSFPFRHWYTFASIILVAAICMAQASLMVLTCKRLNNIDDTAAPAEHLRQWKTYYNFRQRQLAWNLPLYFILLNAALGIYFIEVLSGRPLTNILVILGIYSGWMLFAWFYLGRKSLRKERNRLQTIMDELEVKASGFQEKS